MPDQNPHATGTRAATLCAYCKGYPDRPHPACVAADKHPQATGTPPSFVLTQAIMRIVREGGPYVEAAIENECAHALRKARES